jgi:DnaJ-class molecular chaperone
MAAFTLDDIKQAYRKLALQYHPDKSGTPATAPRFIEITSAYETCLAEGSYYLNLVFALPY